MIERLKNTLLERDMRKRLPDIQRNKRFYNLDTAQSIAVVYDASDEKEYRRVHSFIRHLSSMDKKVFSLGYVGLKELPHYGVQTIHTDYLLTSDMNFYRKPTSVFARDFISKEFHILIGINRKRNPVLRYVSALSRAQYKVGSYHEDDKEFFDFMLQGIADDDLSSFLKEMLHYLEVLGKEG